MSKIYDEEDLVEAIRVFVRDNLNTKINSINTEKTDFDIDTITADDTRYVLAGSLLDLPNHTFCQVAIDGEIEVKTNHNCKASVVTIFVEVAFDNPKNSMVYQTSLRYMRAVYETILDFASSAIEADGFEVTKAIPMIVTNKGRQLVVSGAGLTVAIG